MEVKTRRLSNNSNDSFDDEEHTSVTPFEDSDLKFHGVRHHSTRSVNIRFMAKVGCGEDVIFASITNQIPDKIPGEEEEEEEEGDNDKKEETPSPPGHDSYETPPPLNKKTTGKYTLNLREAKKYVEVDGKFGKKVFKLQLCPQTPMIGNLKRKASWFPKLSRSQLLMVECAFVVYSIDDLSSFNKADDILAQLSDLDTKRMIKLLVANAAKPLQSVRTVSFEEGRKCSERYDCVGFFEVDPSDGKQTASICDFIGRALYDQMKDHGDSKEEEEGVDSVGNRTNSDAPGAPRRPSTSGGSCCITM
eukprot:g1239.t1